MKRWHLVVAAMLLASAAAYAQGGRVQSTADLKVLDGWGRPLSDPGTPGPAPVRDISGMWEPADGPGAGIQPNGPVSMRSDGVNEPPYTPAGKIAYDSHGALYGYRSVLPSMSNDPRNNCDPLYHLRVVPDLTSGVAVTVS